MKRAYIVIIFALVIIFTLVYFSVYGLHVISVDKSVYSAGEEIKIHWSEFNLKWCACNGEMIQIFKQEATGWERVQYELYGFGSNVCVNGKIVNLAMPCDVVYCSFPKLNFKRGDFLWNSKIYEIKGFADSCLDQYNNEIISKNMRIYDLKNAPIGKYKIQFGNFYKIIEIR